MAPRIEPGPKKPAKRKRDNDGPSITTAPVRSLDKLLSLDKDFETFEERLEHAVRIAKIPDDWDRTDVSDQELQAPDTSRFHGRAEWVLRWLLEKLRSQETIGSTARSSPRAWTLLKALAHLMPLSNVARLLNASGFLSTLERTLEENCTPKPADIARSEAVAAGSTLQTRQSTLDSSTTLEEQSKPTRKRKRQGSSVEHGPPSKRPLRGNAVTILLDSIVECLHTIVLLSKDVDQEAASRQHMKFVLQTDSTQAARILRNWLLAVVLAHQYGSKPPVSLNYAHMKASCFSSILEIWNSRSIDTDDEINVSASLFSSQCLVPATVLLAMLTDSEFAAGEAVAASDKRDTILLLHRLFAKHLFLPARSAFFGSTEDRRVLYNSADRQHADARLVALLKPLQEELTQSTEKEIVTAADDRPDAMRRALPLLFNVAIRCSPASTPRRKITERPWLQAVFRGLGRCAGLSLSNVTEDKPLQNESLSTLEALLQVVMDRKISLDADVLETITRQYTDLFGDSEATVRWKLISKVLALDPNVLLDSSGSRKAQEKLGATSRSITDALFIRLSAERADDPHHDAPYISDNTTDGKDARNPHCSRVLHRAEYEYVKTAILIPLMQAFAHSRDLNGFLSRWFVNLRKNLSKTSAPSVWEDEDVALALRPLLESSLMPHQISDLLDQYATHLSNLRELLRGSDIGGRGLTESETWLNSLASVVLLHAVLSAISSGSLVDQLHGIVLAIHDVLLALGGIQTVDDSAAISRVWRLLSRTYDMLLPFQDSALRESHSRQMLSSDCFQRARKAIGDVDTRLGLADLEMVYEAFVLVSTVCNGMSEVKGFQETICKEMNGIITPLVKPFSLKHLRHEDAAGRKHKSRSRKATLHEALALRIASGFVRFPDLLK